MMALFKWYLDPFSPYQLKKKKNKTSELDPLLKKLSVFPHVNYFCFFKDKGCQDKYIHYDLVYDV